MRPGTRHEPRVLELRIHGIKNTPPAEMLEVRPEHVVADHSDGLGGFWTAKTSGAPAAVRREAYSWGALARSGGTAPALVGQFLLHLGWFLVLPFGLVNVAYWTRRIPAQTTDGEWNGGPGSAYIRWFALGLTLLSVVSVATVTLDVIGVQCYRAVGVCTRLPEAFDTIAGLPRAGRLGILALVPILLVVLLWVISHRGRMRFEPGIDQLAGSMKSARGGPVLASSAFWTRARVAQGTKRLHVAAAAFAVAALLAWDHLFSPYPGCRAPERFVDTGCLAIDGPLAALPFSTACLVVALVGLVVVIVLTGPGSPGFGMTARRRWSLALLVTSVAVFGLTTVVTVVDDPGRERIRSSFVGLVAVPVNLVGLLLVLAIAALGWRRGVPRVVTAVLIAVAIAVPFSRYLLAGVFPFGAEHPGIYVGATGVAVLAQVVAVWWFSRRRRVETATVGWGGAGPGVVLLLALGIAMTFSTMLVGGVAKWLAQPVADPGCSNLCGSVDSTGRWRGDGIGVPPPEIELPAVYADFAFWVLGALSLLLVLAGLMALRQFSGFALLSTPVLAGTQDPPSVTEFDTLSYAGTRPRVARFPIPPAPRLLRTRRMSALAHRAEPVLGVLALLFGLALALTAAPDVTDTFSTLVNDIAPPVALGIIAAGAVAAVACIAANALTTKERPLGLLWDLLCFLPRAGHPFAPPCYSERVVPEIDARVRAWLAPPGERVTREIGRRSVVLSAHSLGAVLAVASLFALTSDPAIRRGSLGLVTYGCQLRPLFGRFFPELLGPAVLGTRPCRAPSLFGRDPWFTQVVVDEGAAGLPPVPDPDSLVGRLTDRRHGSGSTPPAWTNLWRRTDFLGFPSMSYAPNAIDRGASELDRRTYLPAIATHSHYPLAPQYEIALDEVIRRMRRVRRVT